jgi:hypothetical protein
MIDDPYCCFPNFKKERKSWTDFPTQDTMERFPTKGNHGGISHLLCKSQQKPISSIIIVVVPVTFIYCTCGSGKVSE